MNDALVLVDVQRDYFPGGRLPLPGAEAALARALSLLSEVRARRGSIFFVRQQSVHPGAAFLLAGSAGAELHPALAPRAGERVIDKASPNAFLGTSLEAELRAAGVTGLAIAGLMTNMCVDATVRQARDLGFACTVVADACAACELTWQDRRVAAADVHAAFVAALGMGYARIV